VIECLRAFGHVGFFVSRDIRRLTRSSRFTALTRAGVPADKIETGAFGDDQLRRERRVEVLIRPPGISAKAR
jgi:hypothetical protein